MDAGGGIRVDAGGGMGRREKGKGRMEVIKLRQEKLRYAGGGGRREKVGRGMLHVCCMV